MNDKQIKEAEHYINLNIAVHTGLRNPNAVPLTQERKDALAHHLCKINQLLREVIDDSKDSLENGEMNHE